jgi:hypothetical protein
MQKSEINLSLHLRSSLFVLETIKIKSNYNLGNVFALKSLILKVIYVYWKRFLFGLAVSKDVAVIIWVFKKLMTQ